MSKSKSNRRNQRDTFRIANARASQRARALLDSYRLGMSDSMMDVSDKRRYSPNIVRKPARFDFRMYKVRKSFHATSNVRNPNLSIHTRPAFDVELEKFYVCARRKVRKEVLHALGLNRIFNRRRGGSGARRRRFNADSSIHC